MLHYSEHGSIEKAPQTPGSTHIFEMAVSGGQKTMSPLVQNGLAFGWGPRLTVVLFLLLLACAASGQDFRSANWGMSDEAVKRLEGKDCSTKSDPKNPEQFKLVYDERESNRQIKRTRVLVTRRAAGAYYRSSGQATGFEIE